MHSFYIHVGYAHVHVYTLLLQVIFEMMLSSSFDMDIIHSTSSAVYAIICSNKVYTYTVYTCTCLHMCIYMYIVHIVWYIAQKGQKEEKDIQHALYS